MGIRFSTFHILEITAAIAINLAVGRVLVVQLEGQQSPNPGVFPVVGGLSGACLGFRWFRSQETAWCGLNSLLVATGTTFASVVPLVLAAFFDYPSQQWPLASFSANFLCLLMALCLAGGIVGALSVIIPVAIMKKVEDSRK